MRVVNRNPEEMNTEYIERLAEEFKKSKEAIESMTKRQEAMKKELTDFVLTHGRADEKGSLYLTVGDFDMKRERRISRSLDLNAVQEWAQENGYWDDIKEVIEVVNEDKLMNLAWQNEQVAETLESFYTVKEVWAFKI